MQRALVAGIAVASLAGVMGTRRTATAQAAPESAPACTLNKGTYTCDWNAFRQRFAAARTVTVQALPVAAVDRVTAQRLRELVETLGKNVAPPEEPGDLTFRIAAANSSGIVMGPADQRLATLQVYARGTDGGAPTLLWVETYTGQGDRPWPMVVNALANQFQARFHIKGR